MNYSIQGSVIEFRKYALHFLVLLEEIPSVTVFLAKLYADFILFNLQEPDLNFTVSALFVVFFYHDVGQLPHSAVNLKFQDLVLQPFNDFLENIIWSIGTEKQCVSGDGKFERSKWRVYCFLLRLFLGSTHIFQTCVVLLGLINVFVF